MKQKIAIIASVLLLTFGLTSNGFSQWVFMANPFHLHSHLPGFGGAESISGDSKNVFAGGYTGVFHSNDNGVTWDSIGFPRGEITCLLKDAENIFVGDNNGLHRSSDNGKTWINIDSGIIGGSRTIAKLGSTMIANCSYRNINYGNPFYTIVRTEDNGMTWLPADSGVQVYKYVAAFAKVESTIVGSTSYGIIKSINGGISWSLADPVLPPINCFAVSGTSLFAGTDSSIFRSMNDGMNWDKVYSIQGPFANFVSSIVVNGTSIFASVYNNGVSRSTDNGATWYDVSAGLGLGQGIHTLASAGDFLFLGSNGGIYRRSFADLADVKENPTQPNLNISLSPNPTTGIITVSAAADFRTNILHVTVSSILGESVLELEHPNAPDFTLDLSKLPAGIYFAKFVVGGEVVTRKIIKE